MVAQLASLGLPTYIKPYKGNISDEEQYRDCVPEPASLLSEGDLHSMDAMKERKDPIPKGGFEMILSNLNPLN